MAISSAIFRCGRSRPEIENTWRAGAVRVYRNWIKYLKEQKRGGRSSAALERARRASA